MGNQCQTILTDPLDEQAVLFETQAQTSLENNNPDQAIWNLHRALECYIQSHGSCHQTVADCYHKLIRVHERQLMLHEALEFYRNVFEIYNALYGWNDSRTLEICKTLAGRYHTENEFEKSAYYYDILLKANVDAYGDSSKETAEIHDKLGSVYQDMEKYRDSVRHFARALDIKKRANTIDIDSLANEYNKLGGVFADNVGDLDGAKDCFEHTLDLMKKTHGDVHEEISIAFLNLGHVKAKLKQFDSARSDIEDCINIGKQCTWALADTKTSTLEMAYLLLGLIHEAQGRTRDALECEKSWVKLVLKDEEEKGKSNEEDQETVFYHQVYYSRVLGNICIELGQYSDAVKHFTGALEILKQLREDELEFGRTFFRLGVALMLENNDQALDFFKQSLESFSKAYNQGCDEIYEVMKQVAMFKIRQGAEKEGFEDLNELLGIYQQRYKEYENHIAVTDVKYHLGIAYKIVGNYDQSLKFLNEAQKEREDIHIGYIRRYGPKQAMVYEVNGIAFDMPELERIVDKHCEILKVEVKRMQARADLIEKPKIVPSLADIRKELVDVRNKVGPI